MKNLLVNSEKQSRFFFKWMQYASISYIVNLQWRVSSFFFLLLLLFLHWISLSNFCSISASCTWWLLLHLPFICSIFIKLHLFVLLLVIFFVLILLSAFWLFLNSIQNFKSSFLMLIHYKKINRKHNSLIVNHMCFIVMKIM